MNTLKKENIRNQLFHLSKESVKYIILKSKCGITLPSKELKVKNIPNFDINSIKSFSPLLCVYKKASPKLIELDNKLCFDEDTFRRKVSILSNAFMTLSLLELADYYKSFKDIDDNKFNNYYLYNMIVKKQLEFYTSYLRNEEGVFVDKKDITSNILEEIKFEDKDKSFNFSDQALLMAAFYKYSCNKMESDSETFYNFSMDIFKMLRNFKDEFYNLSYKELNKLCLGLNIYYDYSKNEDAKIMLLDVCEFLMETYNSNLEFLNEEKVEYDCMTYINFYLFYKNTNIVKFKDKANLIGKKLYNLYDLDYEIFSNNIDKKEVTYYCSEIMLYLISMVMSSIDDENSYSNVAEAVFNNMVIDSGLILSWPDAPNINDKERYENSSMNADDMIEDINFRMPSMPLPENSEFAPVFIKDIVYNRKKMIFTQGKMNFDSIKNFTIFYLILYLLKPNYKKILKTSNE